MQRAPGGRDRLEARQRISACSAGARPAGGQRRVPLPAAPRSGRRPGGAAPRPAAAGPAAPRASCGKRPGPAGKAPPVPHTPCGRSTPPSPSPPRAAPRPLLLLGAPRETAALRCSRSVAEAGAGRSELASGRAAAGTWPPCPPRLAPSLPRGGAPPPPPRPAPPPAYKSRRAPRGRPRGLAAGGERDCGRCSPARLRPREARAGSLQPRRHLPGASAGFPSPLVSPRASLPVLTLPESPLPPALSVLCVLC